MYKGNVCMHLEYLIVCLLAIHNSLIDSQNVSQLYFNANDWCKCQLLNLG